MQLLVERMVPGERLQFRQELRVLAEREPGLDERPVSPQAQLLQTLRLLPQPGQAIDVGQRLPPPQRQRVAQLLLAGAIGGLDALPDQLFGGGDIRVYPPRIEQVPRRARHDRVTAAQHLAQVRDVALQSIQLRHGRLVAPDHIGEPVVADDVTALQREYRQDRLATQPADRPERSVDNHVNWPEKPYPHPPLPRPEVRPPLPKRTTRLSGSGIQNRTAPWSAAGTRRCLQRDALISDLAHDHGLRLDPSR